MHTVLYSEAMYPDLSVEREVYGPDTAIRMPNTEDGTDSIADLGEADCAAADGLMIFRRWLTAEDLRRFNRLRVVVRMGVGYDRLDRKALAERDILVCNTPDYGTTEVADHAMSLALALRRGLLLHHHAQRSDPPGAWTIIESPLIVRSNVQTFGILGLGRIGTAVALRAKAFGFNVMFHDPYLPNGVELALGISRAATLHSLLQAADVLSVHAPLTPLTRGMLGAAELALLPPGAVLVNTARGPIVDIEALYLALRDGTLAGAGLDVIPTEPPGDAAPALLRDYRAHAPWLEGRVIVTPHSAFHSPQAWADIRRKSAETMAAALAGQPRNVIPPDMH